MSELPFKRFVFWQNILSFHQSAFIRSLSDDLGIEVYFAYEEDLPDGRRKMGWTLPDFGNAVTLDVRQEINRNLLLEMRDAQTCHAFGSYYVNPIGYAAFRQLRRAPCYRVWISEAFNFTGVKGFLRTVRCRKHAMLEAREAFHRIFGMGQLGVDFFSRAWLSKEQIREFAYTVEPEHQAQTAPKEYFEESDLLYVGQLIPRKGVDLLMKALRYVERPVRVKIVGDGSERENLERLSRLLPLRHKVLFVGNLPNQQVRSEMLKSRTLVLPSRWDGWGAVVNEALLCGTRVIASNHCGSSSLICDPVCGDVFESGSSHKLATAIRSHCPNGNVKHSRLGLAAWAKNAIGSKAIAQYFVRSISDPNPIPPPWTASTFLNSV